MSNPSGYALGIWLLVSHAPSCIGTTNPSRTGLNPLSIQIYLSSIFVVKGSRPSKDSNVTGQRWTNGISHIVWNGALFHPEAKVTKWVLNCILPMVEWRTDTNNCFDDLEVYMEYGYVSVSSSGRNHAKIAYSPFNMQLVITRAPSQYKDRLIYVWRFPC